MKKALLSVSDKTGIVEFAQGLIALGFEILSTGGTADLLIQQNIAVQKVEDYTHFPEMLDGRVKTLHPKIHGGILALRENPEHMQTLQHHQIAPIDLVCVNLYPFVQTVAQENVQLEQAIENIDIGGPSMIRAAAKNFQSVAVVTDPTDYALILKNFEKNSALTVENHLDYPKRVLYIQKMYGFLGYSNFKQ